MADLPKLPVPHSELPKYIFDHKEKPIAEILEPYRQYEANLRTVYAQDRQNPILEDPYINVVPLFTEDTKLITTHARNLEAESEEEKSKYIMALPDDKRRPHDSPATVADLEEFQKNFNIFSESSMTDMDWSNVVAAGSSVVNCLLPVPKEFNTTKRKLREYYHEKYCPASDVDLFLYGLNHEQALEKIKQIEKAVKDAILNEVTVVRTKYAITIASQYPVRHIQIVLRVYKSVSEILTGFDIDAAGGAYTGDQVYVTPRALGSFMTQINHIDLTRRSPSYEHRLSKYAKKNFEVYWPDLDRKQIDPTIFERSFSRTLGLARLLVLERLPTTTARETYLDKRRDERGRPRVYRNHQVLHGNIKDYHEDEISDWLSGEDISNYHTFTVPYGQHFNAKRIEKLCYTRDLLLNAEWNQSDDRQVYLHRHPAFFGRVEDVIEDCCGSCPEPVTDEEKEVAEKEAQIYIKGRVSFLIDDPGRQQIGSFNPLTEQDWTDMAYVGNVTRLCQSIVDGDVDDVSNWLSQEDSDPNKRDYTGRSPLHLAVMMSTPEVVKCLVEHGARLTARLADGKNALHLAAARGDVEIIKILMEKSIENEEAEEERQDKKRQAAKSSKSDVKKEASRDEASEEDNDESDGEIVDDETTDVDAVSMTTGSFVKVKQGEEDEVEDLVPDEAQDEPDFFNVDALAWDLQCSPLHLAIAEGNEDAVKLLCDYGTDAILPVKGNDDNRAILTLVLALELPKNKAKSMANLLLKLGATSAQADTIGCTAFHKYVESGEEDLIDTLLDNDKTGIKAAINHMICDSSYWNPDTVAPINTAVQNGDVSLILKLLTAGAAAHINFDTWLKSAKVSGLSDRLGNLEQNQKYYKEGVEQPLITAIRSGHTDIAIKLLENGADPNSLNTETQRLMVNEYQRSYTKGRSVLDLVRSALKRLRGYTPEKKELAPPMETPGLEEFLSKFTAGTYSHWVISTEVDDAKKKFAERRTKYEKQIETHTEPKGLSEKIDAIRELLTGFEAVEEALTSRGGKTFNELHPDIKTGGRNNTTSYHRSDEDEKAPKPFDYHFSFNNDRDMTEKRRDAYVELQAWGTEQDQPPLKIAVSDNMGNTPFSVAFLRGHHGIAKALLEIIKAQWSPPKTDKMRFRMETGDEDEEDDENSYNSDDSGDSEPRIVSEKVQQKFTIDDIGRVSMEVESHTKPLQAICQAVPSWFMEKGQPMYEKQFRSLFVHTFANNDTAGLKALLDMAQHYSGQKFEGDDDDDEDEDGSSSRFTFPQADFKWAVEHDWATAGRGMVIKSTGLKTPPLLHAALEGSVESVELFLGDAPHRMYSEFAKSKASKEDSRFKHLKESPGGFDRAISKWLGADNDLVIHCAVLAQPGDKADELLEFLVETCPDFIEKKNSEGDTPLLVACRFGRIDAVKILLAANADQSARNQKGENIVHAAVSCNPKAHQLRELLDLLDPDLRSHLFLQRRNLSENGTTPLHTWVSQASGRQDGNNSRSDWRRYSSYGYNMPYNRDEKEIVLMLNLLLEYSKGEELEMLNGAGDTCLHTAIMTDMLAVVRVLVQFKPSLLYRENAVGRTPAEVAQDQLTGQKFTMPDKPKLYNQDHVRDTVEKNEENFVHEAAVEGRTFEQARELLQGLGLSDTYKSIDVPMILASMGVEEHHSEKNKLDGRTIDEVLWDLCRTAMQKHPGSRRLVSLNEANDVAKRLGEKYSASRYFSVQARVDDEDDDGEEKEANNTIDFAVQEMKSRLGWAWRTE
ncbi:Ff.00g094220.m01.CDS01 [Fusarium sp. VM40]|nr:Ff.00g094220.m01.CDS01 [Fusarium sp. VM40]